MRSTVPPGKRQLPVQPKSRAPRAAYNFRVYIERILCSFPDSNSPLDKLHAARSRRFDAPWREHISAANDPGGLTEYLPKLFLDFPGWHVGARVADESLAIGHFHARQRGFVQVGFFADNSVQVENEGRNRIGLCGCGNRKADPCLARAVSLARPAFSTQLPDASLQDDRRFLLPCRELFGSFAIEVNTSERLVVRIRHGDEPMMMLSAPVFFVVGGLRFGYGGSPREQPHRSTIFREERDFRFDSGF